ncbi:hypothetical protein Hanom_Chr00s004050g01718751 [Helianthus anomalus]
MLKKQTTFFLQTAEVWSIFYSTNVCRCGPQTADTLPLKKQTAPKFYIFLESHKSSYYL